MAREKKLRPVTATDLLGRITPGMTVYSSNGPVEVKSLTWFGDYGLDIIEDTEGHTYPATSLKIPG